MHNPINTMLHEHEIIQQTEEIIRNLDKTWENDAENYQNTIKTLIEFFREYADGYHHRKEEDVLFPAIKENPDFTLVELVDEFEGHHEDFRDYTNEILEALEEEDYEKSYKELTNYLEDLLDHIGAENDELFIMAETLLDDNELENIYFRFMDIDRELGEERKKELEEMIEGLSIRF